MRWGKFILVFQAVITLLIGLVFFSQVFNIQNNYEPEVKEEYSQMGIGTVIVYEELAKYNEFKMRFFRMSYILVVISLMEMLILWRLFDVKQVASFDTEFNFKSDYSFKQ